MLEAQAEYNTLKEDELRMTAELLGMNMAQIDGLMTLMNHARVESGYIGQSVVDTVPEQLTRSSCSLRLYRYKLCYWWTRKKIIQSIPISGWLWKYEPCL